MLTILNRSFWLSTLNELKTLYPLDIQNYQNLKKGLKYRCKELHFMSLL